MTAFRRRPAGRWRVRSEAALALVLAVGALACGEDAPPLPTLVEVPDFTLTDHDGQPYGAAQLEGKVSVVDFIFTNCPTVCPTMTTQMANLQRRLDAMNGVQFLSVTVDPRNDTPEVLAAYAEQYRADTSNWRFVTGDFEAVNRAVVQGFRVRMGEPADRPDGRYDIAHATHFILVDRNRHIRGYYRTDGESLDNLARDVGRLLEESP